MAIYTSKIIKNSLMKTVLSASVPQAPCNFSRRGDYC